MVTGYPYGGNYFGSGGNFPAAQNRSSIDPEMNAYFTQITDPEYRKAMQQQNLFSNLLNFGARMSAAGAPSLDPGYAAEPVPVLWLV